MQQVFIRNHALSAIQEFLNNRSSKEWALLVTGLDGIGKSTLLQKIEESYEKSNTSLVVRLDFSLDDICKDWLTILCEIVDATKTYCAAEQVQECNNELKAARHYLRAKLSQQDNYKIQQILKVEAQGTAQGNKMATTIQNVVHERQHRFEDQVKATAIDAVIKCLHTFQGKQLIILLDSYERLSFVSKYRHTRKWVEDTLLPRFNRRFNKPPITHKNQDHQTTEWFCRIVIASRSEHYLQAVPNLRLITLAPYTLDECETYLQPYGIPSEYIRDLHTLTHGHPLCLDIVYKFYSSNKSLATLSYEFYSEAWKILIQQRVLRDFPSESEPGNQAQRLYRHLILYGSAAEFLDLPLIRLLFPDLLAPAKMPDEETHLSTPDHLDMYSDFKRLSCVVEYQHYCSIHDLIRSIIRNEFPPLDAKQWEIYCKKIKKYYNNYRENTASSDERISVFVRLRKSFIRFFKPSTQGRDHRHMA